MRVSRSVVIAELDVVSISVYESKTNSPLVVYRDRVLPASISPKCVKPIPRRNSKIIKPHRQVQVLKLSRSTYGYMSGDTLSLTGDIEVLRTTICERFYHETNVTGHVT